jgi:ATP-dependent DNA helicase RecG
MAVCEKAARNAEIQAFPPSHPKQVLTELVGIAEKYIRSNIRWRVVLDGSIQRKEIPEIPIEAIREAIINSYCHRLYSSSQNNEITIYSNRIEIYNPGTFPEGLKPEDFIVGDEPSIKRNPLLAQLMYYTKDIENFGTGLKRITVACKEADVKVEFRMMKRGFAVVFYRPNEKFNVTEKMSDGTINGTLNDALSKAEQATLAVIKQHTAINADTIAELISKSRRSVQRYLESLQTKNLIRRIGSKKDGRWEIVENADSTDK